MKRILATVASGVGHAKHAACFDAHSDLLNLVEIGERIGGQHKETGLESVVKNALVVNAAMHCGEISCLKGLQGQKGYPM